jgi:hypothetical protein
MQWSNSRLPSLKRLWDLTLYFRKVQVILFTGTVRNTSDPMSTLFIGSKEAAYLFAEVAYSKIDKVLSLGKYPGFEINPSRLPSADIAMACVGKLSMDKFLKNHYVVLPSVSFSLDLNSPTCDMMKAMSRRRRRDISKLKTYNYSYSVCRNDERSFDFFYWKMYCPYTTKRFGKATILRSYLTAKACYRDNGGIIFVKKAEKPIAGILFQIHGRTLRALSLGVYEGKRDLLKALAGQAALFFLIEWAKTEGITSLNYGYTMPFLEYGNFQYKREWGMVLETEANEPFCTLRLNHLSSGSLSFLSQNPFIFSDNGSMKSAVFVNHNITETELKHMAHEYLFPKLDSLIVISCSSHSTEPEKNHETPARHTRTQRAFAGPLSSACMLLQEQGLNVKTLQVPRARSKWLHRFMYSLKHSTQRSDLKLQRRTLFPTQNNS